jgi:hypothetical protein
MWKPYREHTDEALEVGRSANFLKIALSGLVRMFRLADPSSRKCPYILVCAYRTEP